MLTARNVVIATIVVAVLSVCASLITLLRPIDAEGKGANSYGTRGRGFRALFEILKDLKAPVERGLVPPDGFVERPVTLVFLAAHWNLVKSEPVYLQHVANWVRRGGRVVVAIGTSSDSGLDLPFGLAIPTKGLEQSQILRELGLSTIEIEEATLADDDQAGETSNANSTERSQAGDESISRDGILDSLRKATQVEVEPAAVFPIEVTGDLKEILKDVKSVNVPLENLQTVQGRETETAAGSLTIKDSSGTAYTLVASYRQGAGEIIVIGDPALLQNRYIATSDNSVLAVRLLDVGGRPIILDEFYHGLTIRGNPLWLLTRFPFGPIAAIVLAVVALWAWRNAVFLGPVHPLEPLEVSRRTLAEYVEAMARFLLHGRSSRPFLLTEVRQGALRALREELGLPHGKEQLEQIASALARKDPHAAKRLVDAITAIDVALSRPRGPDEKETVKALQGVSECL